MRAFHRIIGIIVALQIVLWVVTGLLFNVKYRYDEAYEQLAVKPAVVDAARDWVGPTQAMAAAGVRSGNVRLVHDHRGPHYVVKAGESAYLAIDALTGQPLPEMDATLADQALRSSLTASKHAPRYGAVQGAEKTTAFSPLLEAETPGWQLTLDTGQVVTVNSLTSEISHTSMLNTWIDWTYRVHYMQYTPWKTVNMALVLVFSAMLLLLATSGARIFFTKTRRHGYESRGIHF